MYLEEFQKHCRKVIFSRLLEYHFHNKYRHEQEREKGEGKHYKRGYITMIQKIDLDVLPLTYTQAQRSFYWLQIIACFHDLAHLHF